MNTNNKQPTNDLSKVNLKNETISDIKESEYSRGEHPNSLRNLKPFPKGVSGNPLGRPHKYTKLAESLSKLGSKKVIIEKWNGSKYERIKTDKTNKDIVLETIWSKARVGDIKYVQLLAYLGCLD
tara:strand:- start:285 stop:659 length:375 start_codon:yes stop_codon:yes gene_type:complete